MLSYSLTHQNPAERDVTTTDQVVTGSHFTLNAQRRYKAFRGFGQ